MLILTVSKKRNTQASQFFDSLKSSKLKAAQLKTSINKNII